MMRCKFTDNQFMDALKREDAGLDIPEGCRELGIRTALSISGVPNTVAWTPP